MILRRYSGMSTVSRLLKLRDPATSGQVEGQVGVSICFFLDHAFTLLIPFCCDQGPTLYISGTMSEDNSFDFEDSSLLFDPAKYQPGGTYGSKREIQSEDEEMDDQEEPSSSSAVAEVMEKQGTSSDWDSKPSSTGLKYPNLQVTQNMLRPRRLRRERSPAVDCFQ
jgi:hypothetical protein